MTVQDKLDQIANVLTIRLGDGFEVHVEKYAGTALRVYVHHYADDSRSSAMAAVAMDKPDFRSAVPASFYTDVIREARDLFHRQHTRPSYTADAQTRAWIAYQAIPKV